MTNDIKYKSECIASYLPPTIASARAHSIAFTFIIIFTAEKEKRQNRMQQQQQRKKGKRNNGAQAKERCGN